MEFFVSSLVNRPIEEVFAFLRDIDRHPRDPQSVVPTYSKLTPGPVATGTRYLEVVRMLPGLKWQVSSEIVLIQPPRVLALRWSGRGMHGQTRYELQPVDTQTSLAQRQDLFLHGLLRLFCPLVRLSFGRALAWRMAAIKETLERQGWPAA
jgi:hypothetical protein